MRTLLLVIAVTLVILLTTTGCNNASNTDATTKDSTVKKYSLQRNPDNFSEPH